MGRPLDKRASGGFTITHCWIPGDQSASVNAPIVSQIGTNRYIAQSTVSGLKGPVTLQKADVSAAGQAQIVVIPHDAVLQGTGATITVTNMIALGATIVAGGTGYTNGAQTLTVAGGTTINVTVTGGIVTAVNSVTGGTYTSLPAGGTATTGGGGTGATVNLSYKIGALAVGNGGTGYVNGATLALTGSARGTLTVTNGVVTAVALSNPGSGYTAIPSPAVTGAGTAPNETARTIWYHRVNTWEGHQFVWNAAGGTPNASYASI